MLRTAGMQLVEGVVMFGRKELMCSQAATGCAYSADSRWKCDVRLHMNAIAPALVPPSKPVQGCCEGIACGGACSRWQVVYIKQLIQVNLELCVRQDKAVMHQHAAVECRVPCPTNVHHVPAIHQASIIHLLPRMLSAAQTITSLLLSCGDTHGTPGICSQNEQLAAAACGLAACSWLAGTTGSNNL